MKSPFLPALLWAKPMGLDKLLQAVTPPDVKSYYKFIEESVSKYQEAFTLAKEQNLAQTNSRGDTFHYLCSAIHPDTGAPAYSKQEFLAEANLLIIAGSNTTSTALSSFFFYLMRHSRVYARLISEIRTTFSSPSDIRQGPKLSSCAYLKACLDESMRLTPAIPSKLARRILPGG